MRHMERHPTAVAAVLLILSASTTALAEQPAPGVAAEVVRLDVVVMDARGQLVRDLAANEFELLEDGKPQLATHFAFVGAPPAGAAAPGAGPAASTTAAPTPAASPGRHVVIVFDDLHVASGNLQYAKQALARFVAELLPDDRVALVTTGSPAGVRQLTADRASLAAAINALVSREAFVGPARGSQITAAQAEMVLRGDRTALRLAARSLIAEPGSVFDGGPRAAVEGPGRSAAAGAASVADDSKERAAEREAQRQAEAILAEATRFSTATLSTLADVVRSVAELPGRKICLLVSDGFLVGRGTRSDQTRNLQAVVDAATRSGTVVYAVDSHGLALAGGDASVAGAAVPPGLQQDVERKAVQIFRETLSEVSGDTGGFLVHGTNEPDSGLRRMLADNDAYYLMAYEPTNTRRDGRFRKIEVRLPSHKDFTVRTRTGYFAPDERKRADKDTPAGAAPAVGAAPVIGEAEARRVLDAPVAAHPLPVQLLVAYLDLPPSGPQAVVRARVDLASLNWRQAEGRRRAELDVVSGAYDEAGAPVGPTYTRHVGLDLAPAEYEAALVAGLQYQHRMSLPPGRFDFRLVVADATRTPLGGASRRVEIPDLGQQKLTLSSLFLSTTAAPAGAGVAADAAGVGEALRDVQLVRRFRRGSSVYFQLYVYNVLADEKGASDVVLQAQIRSGDKLLAASKPQPLSFQQKDGVPLPQTNGMSLEGLDPGRYDLRVVVVDRRANATAYRSVDFTVE